MKEQKLLLLEEDAVAVMLNFGHLGYLLNFVNFVNLPCFMALQIIIGPAVEVCNLAK